MNLITVIIVLVVFTITSAIRVPPSWPKKQNPSLSKQYQSRTPGEIAAFSTYVQHKTKENAANIVRHHYPQIHNDWTAIFPMYRQQELDYRNKVLGQNYRDDRTHEPQSNQHVEDDVQVPTRPIYPGEGKWAIKSLRHRPFISQHRFTPSENNDDDAKPEGHEVFNENQQHLFNKQRDQFKDNLNSFPQNHKLGSYIEPEAEAEDNESDEETPEFVPTRLYTQVRRSEDEQHLPADQAEEDRLREVVKDSKIQTVYTEEGYEDSAYDHAGHEKNAEQDEGFAEFDKEIEKAPKKKKYSDAEVAGSEHQQQLKHPMKMKQDKFIKTEETKTTAIKNTKDNNGEEMEISSEIKILTTPNNGTKTHKYIKIFPKVYQYEEKTTPAPLPQENITAKKRLKRNTKYPYYHDSRINPDSPLRYSENMANIPRKTEDDLAFYHQADRVECPEVITDIDPIPQRVKDAETRAENGEETTDVAELAETPRLKNLGDKIDCFKAKYFGENPLDSPFFEEDTIAPVVPIFPLFKNQQVNVQINEIEEDKQQINTEQKTNITKREQEKLNLTEIINQDNVTTAAVNITTTIHPDAEIVNLDEIENQTEPEPITIITTPKYTIDLQPKHIYHQIELLKYLPTVAEDVTESSETQRIGKSLESETTTESLTTTTEATPESQALRKRRRRIRPRRPIFHIFDVNKFLPANSFLDRVIRPNTPPKHNLISEVHYKDEIKPSEQLNVFSDVINNIKNSTNDPLQTAASSDRMAFKQNSLSYQRIKIPHKIYHMKNPEGNSLDNIEETNSFYLTTTTTTMRPIVAHPSRSKNKYSSHRNNEHIYEDLFGKDAIQYDNIELLKINAKPTTTTTTTEYFQDNEGSSTNNSPEVEDEQISEVFGLMPPGPNRYKTIFRQPQPQVEEIKMNHYLVPGMKPPSLKQKVYLYSDYKLHSNAKMKMHRAKRSAQRPRSYSGVERNRNKPIDVEDEEPIVVDDDGDDYVPHRPKNYHYDEETGRIVYENVKKEEPETEEEVIEVTEAPIPKPTRRISATTPRFIDNTAGPSYVEYVKKLKSDPKYQAIPDPTTTEKSKEVTTTTTIKPQSTTPPEFLSILAKVRTDSNYKAIEDKKSTTTTTEPPMEEEEESEESQIKNVQNAPGGQSQVTPAFQIFDINDYLPKVKTYTPRTSIDYSKYKTIERPSLRHNLSSRYNSEDDDLEDVNTSRIPILLEEKDNPMMSESKHEDTAPSSTTSTTEAPTTTKKIRTRGRLTQRPSINTATSTTEPPVTVAHDKPRRTFPRRRPTRIKLSRTSTPLEPDVEEDTTKIVRRRHQPAADVPQAQDVTSNPKKPRKIDADVQVFQQYDKTKKHGGNYKKEDGDEDNSKERLTDKQVPEEVVTEAPVDSEQKESKIETPDIISNNTKTNPKMEDMQVFQKFDKTKQHGGNYKKEEDESRDVKRETDVDEETPADVLMEDRMDPAEKTDVTTTTTTQSSVEEMPPEKMKEVQVFKDYDKTKKHGGNYRKEHDEGESKHQVTRLTDVVPKPIAFYTDPKLPNNVNLLMEKQPGNSDEASAEEENEEISDEEADVYDADYDEEKVATTKKPFFIKDPSKRLYFYAPI